MRKDGLFQKGIKQSRDMIIKRIAARKGYKHSKETKQKIGVSNSGEHKFWKHGTKEEAEKQKKLYGLKRQKTPQGRFNVYKQDAKKRKLLFDISIEDFRKIIELKCFYCGGDGCGVDRLNNNIGYIRLNCVPCCTLCNKMKSNRDLNTFIHQCYKISKYYIDSHN
jgi:hypothetical protein